MQYIIFQSFFYTQKKTPYPQMTKLLHYFLFIISFLALFISTTDTAQAQLTGSCLPTNETCTADAGVPKPTSPIVVVSDSPSFFQASGDFSTNPTYNITDYSYEYVITESIDTAGNGTYVDIIVGVTENGSYDVSDLELKDYKVTGFIFCQKELDAIVTNTLIQSAFPGLEAGMSLGDILTTLFGSGLLPSNQFTIDDVLNLLTGPIPGFPLTLSQLIGFQPCVDASNEFFTITLVQENVGIQNANSLKNSTVIAYPNPVQNGVLNLKFSATDNIQNISLIDAVGKVIFEMPQPQQESMKINTEQLNAGNYLLKYIENNKLYIKKIQILK